MANYLRVNQVAKMIGIGKSTVWLWVRENRLIHPIKISARVTVWEESAIRKWQEEKKEESALENKS